MSQERIYILIARKLAGEATDEELGELDQLLGRDPEMCYSWGIIDGLEDLNDANGLPEAAEKDLLERSRQARDTQLELDNEARRGRRRVLVIRSMTLAALVVLLTIGGIFFFHRRGLNTVFGNEVMTKVASKTTIVLPDGSKVCLNSCSRLIYADGFSKGNRTVTLYGEGYFEVKHDPVHPFIIHAGAAAVKVLGTKVNVKAYPEDNTLVTTLIQGKAEVDFTGAAHQVVVLKPGQKITICKNPLEASPETAGAAPLTDFAVLTVRQDPGRQIPEIAWTNDNLEFTGETFQELSHDLARRYDVQLHFQNAKYQQKVFSGAFGSADIGEVMHALQRTSDFHYRIDSLNEVYIW